MLVFLLSSAYFHNSDGGTGLFSFNTVPYFLWRSLKKRFCESVSLREGSVLFHRRVALEWNVLRPAMATLDIVNIRGKIFWTTAITDFMEKR